MAGHYKGRIWLSALVTAMAVASCGSGGPAFRTVSGISSLPNESLQDWVSYGDAVAVVQIASEDGESALTPEEEAAGEGLTVRHVTAEVRSIVWTAPNVGHDDPPPSFSIDAPGWIYADGSKHPYVMEDGNRLEVGDTYLMPIAEFDAGGWKPIGFGVPLAGEQSLRVVPGEQEATATEGRSIVDPPAAVELSGLTVDAAADLIAATAPDPVAAQHVDLDPQARFREVTRQEQAVEGPGAPAPGER